MTFDKEESVKVMYEKSWMIAILQPIEKTDQ